MKYGLVFHRVSHTSVIVDCRHWQGSSVSLQPVFLGQGFKGEYTIQVIGCNDLVFTDFSAHYTHNTLTYLSSNQIFSFSYNLSNSGKKLYINVLRGISIKFFFYQFSFKFCTRYSRMMSNLDSYCHGSFYIIFPIQTKP